MALMIADGFERYENCEFDGKAYAASAGDMAGAIIDLKESIERGKPDWKTYDAAVEKFDEPCIDLGKGEVTGYTVYEGSRKIYEGKIDPQTGKTHIVEIVAPTQDERILRRFLNEQRKELAAWMEKRLMRSVFGGD